jgi:tetratricopeptide (TPR) repeat protein
MKTRHALLAKAAGWKGFFSGILVCVFVVLLSVVYSFALEPIDGQLFGEIDNQLATGQASQALQQLEKLQQQWGARAEIFWRMAQGQYELGRRLGGKPRQDELQQAEVYARAAIAEDPTNDEGYKWLAVALGAKAEDADIGTQVNASRLVKENIEKALALDPEDDISWLILSRWHYKISQLGFFARTLAKIAYGGLPKASMELAEKYLLRAIALHDRIAHRYNLAKVYARQGKRSLAVDQLEKALSLPITFPEEVEDLEKVRRRLNEWREKQAKAAGQDLHSSQ